MLLVLHALSLSDPASAGLAFIDVSSTGSPGFVANLVAAKALASNLFAFYLARGQTTGSLLSIGATNHAHYSGAVTFSPVISQTYWSIKMTSVVADGVSVPAQIEAAIDTGESQLSSHPSNGFLI